jgi:hypothetical protein
MGEQVDETWALKLPVAQEAKRHSEEDRGHSVRGHLLRPPSGVTDLMLARGRPLNTELSCTITMQMGTEDQLGIFCILEG